ncbi:MAG: sigma-70 family RNA polymerase sigma factor [Rhizobacter sp.]|nr:sigma-70 family RNA polymerase sigma factor [Chlorobiales bacterium]
MEIEAKKAGSDRKAIEKTSVEKTAIEKTVEAEGPRLYDFIRQRVASEEVAEDILQDVYYSLLSANLAEPIERLAAWLFRAAQNKVIDWYRKKKSVPMSSMEPDDSEDFTGFNPIAGLVADLSETPEAQYDRTLFQDAFAEALDELPDEQREVFVMHELEGKSFKEIARLTGELENTLLSRKHYAIKFLRERLSEFQVQFQFS